MLNRNNKKYATRRQTRTLVWLANNRQQMRDTAAQAITTGLVQNEEEYLTNLFGMTMQLEQHTTPAPTTPIKPTSTVVNTSEVIEQGVPPINPRMRFNQERFVRPVSARLLDFANEVQNDEERPEPPPAPKIKRRRL